MNSEDVSGPASLVVFDDGNQSTFGGTGHLLTQFKGDNKLRYTGFGSKAACFYDYDFETARLRALKYDESFDTDPKKDVTSS